MKNNAKTILLTYLGFGIYVILDDLYFKAIKTYLIQILNYRGLSHIFTYFISGIPLYLTAILIHANKKNTNTFGTWTLIREGVFVPLFFTLPMFLGYSVLFDINSEITLDDFLIQVVAAAFFEELFFRVFLFGQVFRFTNIGFLPSVLLGAILFGVMHLYQSQVLLESIGIFAITFLGGIFFAWIFTEWNYNTWIPISLHLFMNLSSLIFSASENALGGIYFNIFRVLTVLLAIIFTIYYKRKNGLKFLINKNTLWMKKMNYKST